MLEFFARFVSVRGLCPYFECLFPANRCTSMLGDCRSSWLPYTSRIWRMVLFKLGRVARLGFTEAEEYFSCWRVCNRDCGELKARVDWPEWMMLDV